LEMTTDINLAQTDNSGAENKTYGNSDKWLENADYFRCENISVAYTFPRSVTKLADIRLSLSAQNLFTITEAFETAARRKL
jgi:hypothetical protein